MPPLVAITTSELRTPQRAEPLPQSEPPRHELALSLTYPLAVEGGGAVPMVVPPLPIADVGPLLDRVDGLVISGGPDLDPASYSAEPDPATGPTLPHLDRLELALVAGARDRALPVLALCRGMQLLNVAYGGTLQQDVAGHRQTAIGTEAAHEVEVEPGSLLASVMGCERAAVNSFHHQAVDRLGDGLVAVARTDDGLVEAIEDPAADFVVGVQWHAESMVGRREHCALFTAFAEHAARSQTSRVG